MLSDRPMAQSVSTAKATHEVSEDTVGEIYLNTQKPYYSVGWIERSESQSF
jgi:hypothetical protein